MNGLDWIDELYASFRDGLPAPLRPLGARLAFELRLAPTPATPWRDVFSHEVTLAAPALIAEALPDVARATVRTAVLAHLLAVVEAFGADRVADGQVTSSAELLAVLRELRAARDAALDALDPAGATERAQADRAVALAISRERLLLSGRVPLDHMHYQLLAAGKQQVGLLAAAALARAAGCDDPRVATVRALLEDVAVALQCYDDAVDWEDDFAAGGAWAAALAAPRAGGAFPTTLAEARPMVHAQGTLRWLLERGADCVRDGHRRALALGAPRLARWTEGFHEKLRGLAAREAAHPGFLIRSRALAAWAAEVQVLDVR